MRSRFVALCNGNVCVNARLYFFRLICPFSGTIDTPVFGCLVTSALGGSLARLYS